MRIEICWHILMPVCRACHDFLLLQTAFKNGRRAGIPSADATTANARAVVLRTYSSMLSMSGRIVEIIVARPAAYITTVNTAHKLQKQLKGVPIKVTSQTVQKVGKGKDNNTSLQPARKFAGSVQT